MLTKKQKISQFKKKIVQKIKGKPDKVTPVFIFGEQRSGTNMLINTLNRSIETECFFETDDKAFNAYRLKNQAKLKNLFENASARCVILKSISDSQHANYLLRNFHRAKGIWIYRNYFDVINSSLKNFKEHYKVLEYIVQDPQKAGWRCEKLNKESLELVNTYYEKKVSDASARGLIWYIRNKLFFDQMLMTNNDVLLVKYEQLVLNPKEHFQTIFKFLNIEFKDKFVDKIFSSSVKKDKKNKIDNEIEILCNSLYNKLEDLQSR